MTFEIDLTWWRSWYENGNIQEVNRVLEDHDIPVKSEQKSATLTLIDFDDTLFPTTALREAGIDARSYDIDTISNSFARQIRRCESEAIRLVRKALDGGVVSIVTVASESWVFLAVRNFMPNLAEYLEDNTVNLQSARDDYEQFESGRPRYWKYWAFKSQLDNYFPNVTDLDVIIIGDGDPEKWAAQHVANELGESAAVKMIEIYPGSSVARLTAQLAFTARAFNFIDNHYDECNIEYFFS